MGRLTIKLLRRISPNQRLIGAAYLFWWSIVGGTISTVWIAQTANQKVLMAISWGAITITAYDVIVTSDVRAEQENN
jgi:hypothetical protein